MASITAPTITATGITAPTFPEIVAYITAQFRAIYGNDAYLEPDSQDGQFIAVLALAINDSNAAAIQIYGSFSPSSAQGVALSNNVKINGIRRNVPTYSVVDVTLVGQIGTTITGGAVGNQNADAPRVRWLLPATVVIPLSGEITVTATADTPGAYTANAGDLTQILTPTRGWQTVTNVLAATPGAPVETDTELRARQKISTALPSLSVLEGTLGAVANVSGVTRYRAYENYTSATDANGLPEHSIAIVAEGGDAQTIANAIARHKTPGTNTYGTTAITTFDRYGTPNIIHFFRPTVVPIKAVIEIRPLAGYTSLYASQIIAAVVARINGQQIGEDVLRTKLYTPANLPGTPAEDTFNILSLKLARDAGTPADTDIDMDIDEVASATTASVLVTITP